MTYIHIEVRREVKARTNKQSVNYKGVYIRHKQTVAAAMGTEDSLDCTAVTCNVGV